MGRREPSRRRSRPPLGSRYIHVQCTCRLLQTTSIRRALPCLRRLSSARRSIQATPSVAAANHAVIAPACSARARPHPGYAFGGGGQPRGARPAGSVLATPGCPPVRGASMLPGSVRPRRSGIWTSATLRRPQPTWLPEAASPFARQRRLPARVTIGYRGGRVEVGQPWAPLPCLARRCSGGHRRRGSRPCRLAASLSPPSSGDPEDTEWLLGGVWTWFEAESPPPAQQKQARESDGSTRWGSRCGWVGPGEGAVRQVRLDQVGLTRFNAPRPVYC